MPYGVLSLCRYDGIETSSDALEMDRVAERAAAGEKSYSTDQDWSQCTLTARLQLELLSAVLADPDVYNALIALDEAKDAWSDAVLGVPLWQVQTLLDGFPADPDTWWGAWEALEQDVPEHEIAAAFEEKEEDVGVEAPKPMAALTAVDTVAQSGVGETWILLVGLETNEGAVGRLRVSHCQNGGLFPRSERLTGVAARAVNEAFNAAVQFMEPPLPRYPLEDHEVRVEDLDGSFIPVEGGSLALPVALGFLSLWAEQPLPVDLALTGGLKREGDAILVTGVKGIAAKARAWAAYRTGACALRLVVPGDHGKRASGLGLDVRESSELREIVADLGLDPSAAPRPSLGDVPGRVGELKRLLEHALGSDLREHQIQGPINPWEVLGDRIRIYAESLEGRSPYRELLQRAYSAAVQCYARAGNGHKTDTMLARLSQDSEEKLRDSIRVVRQTARLSSRTGLRRFAADLPADIAELVGLVERLDYDDGLHLCGPALGTVASAQCYLGQLDDALANFRKSLASFEEAETHYQLGRTRLHMAAAYRMRRDPDAARAQLKVAWDSLLQYTRADYGEYFHSTAMYWHYEAARLEVVCGAGEKALWHASEALAPAEMLGWWPSVGILRTQAWAYFLLGDADGARRARRRIAQWLERTEQYGFREIADRIAAEANGPPVEDGEPY